MRALKRYYKKVYSHTNRLLKKVFGLGVRDSMLELNRIKKEIEKEIEKPISEITPEDLYKTKMTFDYCKYKTLDGILGVLSGATFLSSFCEEDMEEIANERN